MDGAALMFAPFADKNCHKSVSICDAIQGFIAFENLEKIIEDNVNVINKKEFHGHTPLHKAALRGEPKITELLLKHGAKVNEPNDYGETPFHFACKQGNVVNVYTLLQNGADQTARDTLGRSGMHHAAIGGSVVAMNYLAEVHDLLYDDVDFEGVTPLHLASAQGFQDAVKYLLRKERSDVRFKDSKGNTALHFACTTGLTETVWTLLEHGGCGMLTEENVNGQSPKTILREGKTRAHAYLSSEMETWLKVSDPNKPPSGPWLSWIVMLLIPTVSYTNIVFTAQLFRGYNGLVVALLTLILCSYTIRQNHRLPHMSRWSNPIFAGAFAAGIFHTGVIYSYKLLPVFWPMYPKLVLASYSLCALMLYMYFRLIMMEPGRCRTSRNSNSLLEEYATVDHIARGTFCSQQFCVYCEIIPEERVKHCKICQKCLYEHDHHCLFLLNCVAKNNHRMFVTFLLLTAVIHVLFITQGVGCLILNYPWAGATWPEFLIPVFFSEGWLNGLIALNAGSIIWELAVVSEQLVRISRGLTISYSPLMPMRHYRMSKRDMISNIYNFMRGRRTYNAKELHDARESYHNTTVRQI